MEEYFGKYILHSTPQLEQMVCCVAFCRDCDVHDAFVSVIPAQPLEAGLSFCIPVNSSASVYHYVEQAALALERCISVMTNAVRQVLRAARRVFTVPEMFLPTVKTVTVQSLCCFRL